MGETYNAPAGAVIACGRFDVAAFWASLPAGWSELTTTGTKPPLGILGFSGSAIRKNEWFFQGGGHTDYWGNEFWRLNLDTLAWSKDYEPDFTANPDITATQPYVDNVNWPGAVMIGGVPTRPISRHTYRSVNWIEHLDRITVGGASTYSGSSGQLWINGSDGLWLNSPKDLWFYDPVDKTFAYKGSTLLNSAYLTNVRFEYHRTRQKGFSIRANTGNKIVVTEFDATANTWTDHPTLCPASGVAECQGVVDDVRDCLWVFWRPAGTGGAVGVYRYDLAGQTWTAISTSGTAPSALQAERTGVVSSKTGKIYFLYNAAAGMAIFDPATGAWTSEATHASMNYTGAGGIWKYDRRRKCGLFATSSGSFRIWAYKD